MDRQGLEITASSHEVEAVKRQSTIAEGFQPKRFDVNAILAEDTLSLYPKKATRVPFLTHNRGIALAKQVDQGRQAAHTLEQESPDPEVIQILDNYIRRGAEARKLSIKANTRLVVSVARKYLASGIPLPDFFQESTTLVTGRPASYFSRNAN